MNKKRLESILFSTVGVVAMFLVLIALNFLAAGFKQRLDLTADKLYTLSEGTKKIIARLDTPVKVRFYCTQGDNAMPVPLKTYAQRIEDMLAEYQQLAKGNLIIEKLDPQPDSPAEDSATLEGVEGQPLPTGEKIYLGLSVSCLDEKFAYAFLTPEREKFLEYDLSRAIAAVANPVKPVIGVMSGLPVFGQPMNPMMMQMGQQGSEPWAFITELKRGFNVRQVELTAEKIDDDIKVLLLLHPSNISDAAQFAVDQFILRGGRLVAFLDPDCVVDSRNSRQSPMGSPPSGSSLDKLLKAWGIEFDRSKVVADKDFLTRISRGSRPEEAPSVISLTTEGINEDIATAQIDSLTLWFPGAFTGTPVAGLKQTVLLHSSENSQLVEGFLAQLSSAQVLKDFKPSGRQYALAIRLTGKFKTAFPDGKPADDKEKKAEPKPADFLKESSTENAVVLVGDADMLYDAFCVQVQELLGQRIIIPRNGNLTLAQNIIEQMSGDASLMAARGRATMSRPFTLVRKMQAQAEASYQAKIKQLEDGLAQTQQRLGELQQSKDKSQRFILSPEQQKELEKFRQQEVSVKKELKELRKNLRHDVESLETRLKWYNLAGMPLLVTLSGIGLALFKRKRTAAK